MRFTPRKRLFVDRQVQGSILMRIGIYWCTSILAIGLFLLFLQGYANPDYSFLDYFSIDVVLLQYATVVAASFLLLPIIMIDVVSLTNRFAGPILRLRRSVRALAAGDYVDPIFFRDNDYWQEFAIEFNALSRHVEELKQELAQANKKLAAQTSSKDEKTSEPAPLPVSFSELPPTQPAGAR